MSTPWITSGGSWARRILPSWSSSNTFPQELQVVIKTFHSSFTRPTKTILFPLTWWWQSKVLWRTTLSMSTDSTMGLNAGSLWETLWESQCWAATIRSFQTHTKLTFFGIRWCTPTAGAMRILDSSSSALSAASFRSLIRSYRLLTLYFRGSVWIQRSSVHPNTTLYWPWQSKILLGESPTTTMALTT